MRKKGEGGRGKRGEGERRGGGREGNGGRGRIGKRTGSGRKDREEGRESYTNVSDVHLYQVTDSQAPIPEISHVVCSTECTHMHLHIYPHPQHPHTHTPIHPHTHTHRSPGEGRFLSPRTPPC